MKSSAAPMGEPAPARCPSSERKATPQELKVLRHAAISVALRLGLRLPDAEDIAQEALLVFVRKEATVETPVAWIRTVAGHFAMRQLCAFVAEGLAAEVDARDGFSAEAAGAARLDARKAIGKLAHRQRRLLLAHHVLGIELRELEHRERLADGTAKVLLARAREKMRRLLDSYSRPS